MMKIHNLVSDDEGVIDIDEDTLMYSPPPVPSASTSNSDDVIEIDEDTETITRPKSELSVQSQDAALSSQNETGNAAIIEIHNSPITVLSDDDDNDADIIEVDDIGEVEDGNIDESEDGHTDSIEEDNIAENEDGNAVKMEGMAEINYNNSVKIEDNDMEIEYHRIVENEEGHSGVTTLDPIQPQPASGFAHIFDSPDAASLPTPPSSPSTDVKDPSLLTTKNEEIDQNLKSQEMLLNTPAAMVVIPSPEREDNFDNLLNSLKEEMMKSIEDKRCDAASIDHLILPSSSCVDENSLEISSSCFSNLQILSPGLIEESLLSPANSSTEHHIKEELLDDQPEELFEHDTLPELKLLTPHFKFEMSQNLGPMTEEAADAPTISSIEQTVEEVPPNVKTEQLSEYDNFTAQEAPTNHSDFEVSQNFGLSTEEIKPTVSSIDHSMDEVSSNIQTENEYGNLATLQLPSSDLKAEASENPELPSSLTIPSTSKILPEKCTVNQFSSGKPSANTSPVSSETKSFNSHPFFFPSFSTEKNMFNCPKMFQFYYQKCSSEQQKLLDKIYLTSNKINGTLDKYSFPNNDDSKICKSNTAVTEPNIKTKNINNQKRKLSDKTKISDGNDLKNHSDTQKQPVIISEKVDKKTNVNPMTEIKETLKMFNTEISETKKVTSENSQNTLKCCENNSAVNKSNSFIDKTLHNYTGNSEDANKCISYKPELLNAVVTPKPSCSTKNSTPKEKKSVKFDNNIEIKEIYSYDDKKNENNLKRSLSEKISDKDINDNISIDDNHPSRKKLKLDNYTSEINGNNQQNRNVVSNDVPGSNNVGIETTSKKLRHSSKHAKQRGLQKICHGAENISKAAKKSKLLSENLKDLNKTENVGIVTLNSENTNTLSPDSSKHRQGSKNITSGSMKSNSADKVYKIVPQLKNLDSDLKVTFKKVHGGGDSCELHNTSNQQNQTLDKPNTKPEKYDNTAVESDVSNNLPFPNEHLDASIKSQVCNEKKNYNATSKPHVSHHDFLHFFQNLMNNKDEQQIMPAGYSSSNYTSNNETSAMPPDHISSKYPPDNETSATPLDYSSSKYPLYKEATATPVDYNSSNYTSNNETRATPPDYISSKYPPNNETRATPEGYSSNYSTNNETRATAAGYSSNYLTNNETRATPAGYSSNYPTNNETRATPESYSSNYPTNNETRATPAGYSSNYPTNNKTRATPAGYSSNYPTNNEIRATPAGYSSNYPTYNETRSTPVGYSSNYPTNNETRSMPVGYSSNYPTNNETRSTPVGYSSNYPTNNETRSTPVGYSSNYPTNNETRSTPVGYSSNYSTNNETTATPVGYSTNYPTNNETRPTPAGCRRSKYPSNNKTSTVRSRQNYASNKTRGTPLGYDNYLGGRMPNLFYHLTTSSTSKLTKFSEYLWRMTFPPNNNKSGYNTQGYMTANSVPVVPVVPQEVNSHVESVWPGTEIRQVNESFSLDFTRQFGTFPDMPIL